MILLRQKLYAKAERNPKSRRKQHRAAKKAWEQQQGDRIIGYEGTLGGIVDADAQARDAIQKEKNGAETIKSGFWSKGKKWKDEVDPKTIEVKEDEISRKKFRNSIDRGKEYHSESWLLKDYRDKSGIFGSEELEELRKKSPELYKERLKKRQEDIRKAIERQDKDRLEDTKNRLRPDGEYAQDLKYKYRTKKLAPRAEEIRKHKSLGQKIKEDLGLGMSRKARKRIAAKNEAEDEIIKYRLKRDAKKNGALIDDSIGSSFTPSRRQGIKNSSGKKGGIITASRGDHLAHELGHEHFSGKDAKGIGKLAHKAYIGSDRHAYLTLASGASSGIASGINKAHKEAKGEKESTLNKLSPALTSLAVASPMLVAEAAASKHGMKLIKNAGTTRRYQKAARREMTRAWGTYASVPLASSGLGYATKNIAYQVESDRLRTKKKKRR